jgi:hypothetical protein
MTITVTITMTITITMTMTITMWRRVRLRGGKRTGRRVRLSLGHHSILSMLHGFHG